MFKPLFTLAFIALAAPAPAFAHDTAKPESRITEGYFEDSQIAPRDLSDWAGDWQSVYPLLQDGSLDPVMAHKAKSGAKTEADYRAYYETGYRSDVTALTITAEGRFDFTKADGSRYGGDYIADGLEVLEYKEGNRGVRFIFKKRSGDAQAPAFVQFSDHRIAPSVADHFHLYWGDDRAALLQEITNWPTFYPAHLSPDQIVHEMIAH